MSYAILTYCHCMCHNDPLSYIGSMWGAMKAFNSQKRMVG